MDDLHIVLDLRFDQRHQDSSFWHERQCARRFALSVPQAAQRMYIARANQAVMIALNPSTPTNTARFSSKFFKYYIFPADSCGNSSLSRNRGEMPRQIHPGNAPQRLNPCQIFSAFSEQPRSRADSLPRRLESFGR